MASFDNSVRPQFLLFWMYGIWTMIFLHNSCVSILLFKNRNNNVSNFLKIIFNLTGLGKALAGVSVTLVPDDVPDVTCQGLGYYAAFDNTIFRMSLSAFLLWRIKQIEFKRSDMLIGCSLFVATSMVQIARVFAAPLHSTFFPITNIHVCAGVTSALYNTLHWLSLGLDFTIDIFVTFRLIQILGRANKNAKFVTSNMQRPFKRTLFTSVMYWNFLRLGVSFIFHLLTAFNAKFGGQIKQVYALPAGFTFVYLTLSYLITVDAEIVRIIEGRTPNSGKGSAGTEKKPYSKGFRHEPTSTESTDYIISAPTLNMTSSRQTEKIDTNTVVSSTKRLSFFEWAKFVMGKKDKDETNDVEQGSMEEIEEKFQNNTDPEFGVVTEEETRLESEHGVVIKEETWQESDHSPATTVTDSKDNRDSMGRAL